jgi:hypothetical protein
MKIRLSLFSITAIFLLPIIINAQEIDKTAIYIFKAKIISVSMVNTENALYVYDYGEFKKRKNGSIFVAGIDSHWAVKMEIVSVDGDKNILKKDEQITFVVHSPTRDIGILENNAIGKEFNLKLHITHKKNNTVSLSIYPNFRAKTSNH